METTTLNLTIDNEQRDFFYRKGTADEAVIVHDLMNASCNFAPLRRAAELADLYARLLRAGKAPLIVDAGANIGASTIFFARKFEKARVVAIEPERGNFSLLSANAVGLPVDCLHAVVAASPAATGPADPQAATEAGGIFEPPACVTINGIYERMGSDTQPFIVKIDAETSDDKLFAANVEWVGRTPIIIFALHDSLIPGTVNSRAFVDYVADSNRDFVYLNDNIFSIDRTPAAIQ